jgi:hypothetical protein
MADKRDGRNTTNCKGQGAKSGSVQAPPLARARMSMMQVQKGAQVSPDLCLERGCQRRRGPRGGFLC